MAGYRDDDKPQSCEVGGTSGIPTCTTGPFGRLSWTLNEIAGILHLRKERSDAR